MRRLAPHLNETTTRAKAALRLPLAWVYRMPLSDCTAISISFPEEDKERDTHSEGAKTPTRSDRRGRGWSGRAPTQRAGGEERRTGAEVVSKVRLQKHISLPAI